MNSIVGPIFNEKVVESDIYGSHEQYTGPTNVIKRRKSKKSAAIVHWTITDVPCCSWQKKKKKQKTQLTNAPQVSVLSKRAYSDSPSPTKLWAPVIKLVSLTIGFVTLQLDGRGEVTICFWNMFYQIFKVKTFYSFFYKRFYC